MNNAWQCFRVRIVAFGLLFVGASLPTLTFADSDPAIVIQPQNQTVLIGSNAAFTATATGTEPLTYRWYFNGSWLGDSDLISGTATPTLTFHGVDPIEAGNFWLIVSNLNGMATSSVVTLTVGRVRYVNVANGSPSAPYTNWATAATVIQDAIDASGPGDLILVTNGTYSTGGRPFQSISTNRVVIDRPISVQSINGPQVTIIQGQKSFGGIRGVYMTNGAFLSGFTIQNSATQKTNDWFRDQSGGGVFCESTAAVLSNCVITANTASKEGGGVYSGTLYNCTLSGNSALEGGGADASILNHCVLSGNGATWGGGAQYGSLNNCTLTGNSAQDPGGARTGEGGGTYSANLTNCILIGNHARVGGGGVIWGSCVNSVLANNSALQGGGASAATVINCTIVGNSAPSDGQVGGGLGGGVLGCPTMNSIIVSNTSTFGGYNFYDSGLSYSCTSPDPGGTSNIVADPLFVDYANGDYRLQANSPCLNTGTNVPDAGVADLDGLPRIVDTIIDMGPYELQHLPFIIGNPSSQSVVLTSNFTFTVSAVGDAPLAYQWYFNGAPLTDGGRVSGVASNALTLTAAQTNDAGNYWVVVSNSLNVATSSVAALTVLLPVTITSQPTNKVVAVGATASFTVAATGLSTLNYAWYSNDVALTNGGRISGANSATLNISNAQTNDTATYYVVITNSYGSLTSSNAALTVLAPAQILTHPVSQAVLLNSNATFAAIATGSEPLNYRWFFNGTLLSDNAHINGSATPTLTISNAQPSDAGGYVLVVTNLLNSATSHLASLTPITEGATSIRYVNISNTTPLAPFLTWSNAATNIQDAVDASVAGDLILVSNGVYKTGGRAVYGATNRVAVDKAVTVQSVNGPAVTAIMGGGTPVARVNGRCVYLTNGASLMGFTLTNGSAGGSDAADAFKVLSGGGVWCESSSVVVSNCILIGNLASHYGGGAFQGTLLNCAFTNNSAARGAGACSNTLVNCTLVRNVGGAFQNSAYGAGAIYSTLSNCLLVANTCSASGGGGGAAFSSLTGCVLSNNFAANGGGLYLSTANFCLISSNRATTGGGGYSNVLNNCILKNNATSSGNGGGAYYSVLANCTVVSNTTPNTAGVGGGIYGGWATNCIVYYNFSPKQPDFLSDMPMYYCCTPTPATNGFGNITNPPVFADLVNGDFHLQATSPCINSGNNLVVTATNDFDGNPRIVGGTVDIGAYEFTAPASTLSYAWAQQHNLPTDGSADSLDSDGDGMSNWQEFIAGTDPNDGSSKLAMLPAPNTNTLGITIMWESALGVPYYVQRCTNLAAHPAFLTIQSNILGQVGTTSYSDTNAPPGIPSLYRVGVEH